MDLSIPKTSQQWNVITEGGATSLKFTKQPVPELGDNQVLVKIRGASLNYRDIMIIQGTYPFDLKPEVIPGSDGAGTVLAVGKNVARFRPGDNVVTMLNPRHLDGSLTKEMSKHVIGSAVDGTLRSVGAFDEQGLVKMPAGLSFTEAATLTCAGLTAWNALFGLSDKKLLPGQWVLTQGTGGVSIFATQFAKAIGARVIAMSSSEEKAELLKRHGADHIINYRETPNWGPIVRDLTEGVGVDYVVEVVGPTTMRQSVASVKLDGVISVVGSVGGEAAEMPNLLECWTKLFTARGLWIGSRIQMEDMCRTIEGNLDVLRPVIDQVFTLEQVEEGLEYLASGKHQGKVCIDIA